MVSSFIYCLSLTCDKICLYQHLDNQFDLLIKKNCQRFNQSILRNKDSSKKKQYCCLAVGSRDRSISIWCTTYQRPLAVVHDLFEDSVLDLSWSQIKDQTILLACSTDGTIAALLLSEDELGISLSAEDKVNYILIIGAVFINFSNHQFVCPEFNISTRIWQKY